MRKLATLACGFALGIFCAQTLFPTESHWDMAFLMAWAPLLGFFHKGHLRKRILLFGWGLSLAFGFQSVYDAQMVAPANALVDTTQTVVLTIVDTPIATNYGAKAEVSMVLDNGQEVQAMYYGDFALLDADIQWQIQDEVEVHSAANIDDTELATFTSQGIFLLLYGQETAVFSPPSQETWSFAQLRRQLQAQIQTCFDTPYDGILTAMLTGDKTNLDAEVSTDLSEAGIYHIMAVSGMHCGFLLAMIAVLAGRHRRKLVALLAIPILLCYMTLVGNTPSVVRACIMLICLLMAPIFNRQEDGITAMSVALVLILLQNPYSIFSVSLQMSFGAMAGILLVSSPVYHWMVGEKKPWKVVQFIALSLSMTVGAMALTAPMSFVYFGIVWVVAPLTNLLCVWAAAWIFASGLLTVVVSWLYLPAGLLLAWVPKIFIDYILLVCDYLGHLPHHAVYDTNPYLRQWMWFAYVLFGLVVVYRKKRSVFGVALVCGYATLAAVIVLGKASLTSNVLDGYVLDVGQGQSVLLSSDGMAVLVDCGSSDSWYSAGDIAGDTLSTMGILELDYLVLTHYDSDHINGVETLLHRMDVDTLLVPLMSEESELGASVIEAAYQAGTNVIFSTQETDYPMGKSTLHIYPPVGTASANESGLSVLSTLDDWCLLITGDMESATEETLLETYSLPKVDVWMVNHHGSSSSTSLALLDVIAPTYGIISVGDNSYGHPTEQTLRRLVINDVTVYRTDLQGTIHFTAN